MRVLLAFATLSLALAGVSHASGTFTELQTPNLTITKLSANGQYAVGSTFAPAGLRWTASTGVEEILPDLNVAMGINNSGTVAGAVPENGGVANGGRDLGAFEAIGESPSLLTDR